MTPSYLKTVFKNDRELTAVVPQSHSSPVSMKPLPHSGGSRSCGKKTKKGLN